MAKIDRIRIGVPCLTAEWSRQYEKKNQPVKIRCILTVAYVTYGSRDLNFYVNIRLIYCMI